MVAQPDPQIRFNGQRSSCPRLYRRLDVAHSRGGIAATQAAEGRHESISTLVYLAADMLRDGESVLDVALGDSESLVLPNLV